MKSIDMQIASLRDSEIRAEVRKHLQKIHADEPDTAIIDELSICQGDARVDVAVVNGSLSGYEIKSDRDTLLRLPGQSSAYELCFNSMTIVAGASHVDDCYAAVPEWWGIWEAVRIEDIVCINPKREPQDNPSIDPRRVVQLLWREEASSALDSLGIKMPAKFPRRELWAALLAATTREQLFKIVRETIRARGDWRSGPTPFRGDGSSLSVATSQRSQENRRWLLSVVSPHRLG